MVKIVLVQTVLEDVVLKPTAVLEDVVLVQTVLEDVVLQPTGPAVWKPGPGVLPLLLTAHL